MLLGNISKIAQNPIQFSGYNGANERSMLGFNQSNSLLRFSVLSPYSAIPTGYLHPSTWALPMKPGYLAITGGMRGEGLIISANLAGGYNLGATLSGIGNISNAEASVLAFLVATLSGTSAFTADISGGLQAICTLTGVGTITGDMTDGITRVFISADLAGTSSMTADMTPALNMAATLGGSGSLTAALTAVGNLVAEINAGGQLTNALMTGLGNLSATISPFTVLSPESLAANVWNSIAADFNTLGTMGNKLNLASSGGIDYTALADAVWEALQANYLNPTQMGGVLNILQTKIDELHKIQGLDIDNPLTITKTLRTAGSIDLDLDSTGDELTIVTRQ